MKKEKQYMELPFEVGDVFKNYKALCEALGEKQRNGGTSRQAHLKRWEEYFLWRREGHKYIITEIIDKRYPTHDNSQFRKEIRYEERHKFDKIFHKKYKKESSQFNNLPLNDSVKNYLIYVRLGYIGSFDLRKHPRMIKELGKLQNKNTIITETIDYIKKFHKIQLRLYRLYNPLSLGEGNLRKDGGTHSKKQKKQKKRKNKRKKYKYIVYKFIDSKNRILYIGKSSKFLSRIYTHFGVNSHLPDELYEKVDRIQFLEFDTQVMMDMAELYFIAKFYPYYNTVKKHNSFENFSHFDELEWDYLDYDI